MHIMKLNRLLSMIVLGALLPGCAAIQGVESQADADMAAANAGVEDLRTAAAASVVHMHLHGYWVDRNEQPLRRTPSKVESCQLVLVEADEITLSQFAEKIKRVCNVPVTVTADARQPDTGGNGPEQGGDPRRPPPVYLSGAGQASASAAPAEPKFRVNWHGALAGLLDTVTAPLGLHWKIQDDVVRIFKLETRVFPIYALPGTDAFASSVTSSAVTSLGADGGGGGGHSGGGSGGGASGSGGSSQTLATSLTSSVMDDIQKTVLAMLTPESGKLTLSKATASLAVTDTPDVLERINDYISAQNKVLTTQIVLNVKLLNVEFDREDQYEIDWNLVYANDGTGEEVTAAADSSLAANVHILRGPFSGSSAMIKALSRQGKVSVITQPSVTTLNLQAAPMQVATQTSYVASVSSTSTPDVGTTSGIQLGSVTTGFSMLMLPYAMADKQILLQYNISLSDLKALKIFGDEQKGRVELPNVDMRAFSQKVRLRSGQTLVLTGFDQQRNDGQRKGVGDPDNMLLGGMRHGTNKHQVVVIMITPVIVG